eukprot:scaffold4943_cov127-Isochrysis_galbana.AAC.5
MSAPITITAFAMIQSSSGACAGWCARAALRRWAVPRVAVSIPNTIVATHAAARHGMNPARQPDTIPKYAPQIWSSHSSNPPAYTSEAGLASSTASCSARPMKPRELAPVIAMPSTSSTKVASGPRQSTAGGDRSRSSKLSPTAHSAEQPKTTA